MNAQMCRAMTVLFCSAIALSGCVVRNSSFAPLPVVAGENVEMHQAGLPKAQNGCGWVVVSEQKTTKVRFVPVNTAARQFERALFYCCPGDAEPNPKCYQADWFYRSGK